MENADLAGASSSLTGLGSSGGKSLLMGLSMWGIMASLVFSGIGYFYYKRGREQSDMVKLSCGIAMMLYPYFVSNAFYIVLLGAALMAAPYVIERI